MNSMKQFSSKAKFLKVLEIGLELNCLLKPASGVVLKLGCLKAAKSRRDSWLLFSSTLFALCEFVLTRSDPRLEDLEFFKTSPIQESVSGI